MEPRWEQGEWDAGTQGRVSAEVLNVFVRQFPDDGWPILGGPAMFDPAVIGTRSRGRSKVTGTWLATPVALFLIADRTHVGGRFPWVAVADVRLRCRRIVSAFLEITTRDGRSTTLGTSRTGGKRLVFAFNEWRALPWNAS